MNVLLIGGASKVMDVMIDKLNKSNHRIYLLPGQKRKAGSSAFYGSL